MAEIDRMHLESPAYGARKIARALNQEGYEVSRWHVRRLMSEMNVRPCCPLPSPSKPTRHSRKFGYLLRDKVISFPNQVWSTDITYVQIGGVICTSPPSSTGTAATSSPGDFLTP